MKKYILILFLLFSGLANAQWATPDRLPHTTVVNTGTFYGKGAGTVNAPIQMIVSPGATIDTASWRFVGSGGDGSNKVMVNRVTYLGRAAGTVYATLVYPVNSTSSYSTTESDTRFLHSADSLKYVYKRDSLTTFVTPAMMNNNARPYKVYTALLTQTGTSAPIASVFENTLGGTVVWSYVGVATYRATLAGVFTSNKTAVFPDNVTFATGDYYSVADIQTDYVEITTNDNGVLPPFFTFEIRVYN